MQSENAGQNQAKYLSQPCRIPETFDLELGNKEREIRPGRSIVGGLAVSSPKTPNKHSWRLQAQLAHGIATPGHRPVADFVR